MSPVGDDRDMWMIKIRQPLAGTELQITIDNGFWMKPLDARRFAAHFAHVLDQLEKKP